MKLPFVVDLDVANNKELVNDCIQNYGISRNYNELAMTVLCKDLNGTYFEIVQFHSNRRLAHFLSYELNKGNE